MAYEESLDFSTESFLDSVLSEFDKIGLSNATPSIATTAPVIHDQSIPTSEQSKEPMGGNQERRNSEADDFELIDLIETHMTEYGLNIGSVSPSLEAESPLNGSVFENISPLDGLTENVGGNGAEQVYGLEKTEREPQFGVDLGSVVLSVTADEISTEQEITGGNEDEVEQSCEAALSAAHVTATGTEMASMDIENGTIEEAWTTKPEMTDVLEHREEIRTASQTSAVTIDAEDAVRDTTEEDDTTPKTSENDSAAPVSAPSMEENIESGDSAWDINEESSTASVTAAVSAMESDGSIEGVVHIRESGFPVEAAAKPEALIPVLDTLEFVQDADGSESVSAAVVKETVPDILVEDATAKVEEARDTKDLATTYMSGTKDVEEPSKSSAEIGDASEPALIDFDISDRSIPVLAANADEWSTETQGRVQAAHEPVPVAEGVTGDEPKVSEVGSAADDTSVLELEAVEPGHEGVAEPAKPVAKPEAVAETATDVSAELKGIEFKEAVSAAAPVEKPHATESTTAEHVPAPSIAEEVEPVLDATTTVPIAIDEDSKVYIYTSFTGGGMFGRNIMTATNRLQLILRSNNIGFEIIDLATNEQAKKLWARSSKGKKLPGIVKGKDIVGNYEDIEEANEFGEVQQLIAEFV
ncbi:hypothetical protein V1522DRAFT_59161 [Lipomyces starkeyi]